MTLPEMGACRVTFTPNSWPPLTVLGSGVTDKITGVTGVCKSTIHTDRGLTRRNARGCRTASGQMHTANVCNAHCCFLDSFCVTSLTTTSLSTTSVGQNPVHVPGGGSVKLVIQGLMIGAPVPTLG